MTQLTALPSVSISAPHVSCSFFLSRILGLKGKDRVRLFEYFLHILLQPRLPDDRENPRYWEGGATSGICIPTTC